MKLVLISLIVLLTCTEVPKTDAYQPVVVLELFTSQGCSSCPPADDLLQEVKKNYKGSEVIALSYHVDYWNYIGWKDPFSKSEYSDLQRQYGKKFNNSTIYTPQMVVNGMEHFVGSNKHTLSSKLRTYSKKNAENSLAITNVRRQGNRIYFEYKVNGAMERKQLRIVLAIDERTTPVSRGENKNRSLKNSNIVVQESLLSLDSPTGKGTLEIPKLVKSSDKLLVIGLIETSDLDIVGGTQITL